MIHLERYEVRHAYEETPCHWCGGPLYVGDVAYRAPDVREVYCSPACAEDADRLDAVRLTDD